MKCIFCEFISGEKKKNINGFPFSVIHETKYSISFQSIDVPNKTKVHVLVIPKKHFQFIEEVPNKIMDDIFSHIKTIIKALRKKYSGVNIIQNNGKSTNQSVPHVHFHIIPRKKGDGFFEGFKKKVKRVKDVKEFKKIQKEVLNLLKN